MTEDNSIIYNASLGFRQLSNLELSDPYGYLLYLLLIETQPKQGKSTPKFVGWSQAQTNIMHTFL